MLYATNSTKSNCTARKGLVGCPLFCAKTKSYTGSNVLARLKITLHLEFGLSYFYNVPSKLDSNSWFRTESEP